MTVATVMDLLKVPPCCNGGALQLKHGNTAMLIFHQLISPDADFPTYSLAFCPRKYFFGESSKGFCVKLEKKNAKTSEQKALFYI
jgi:hypothetical protein